jgi:hypothetical protein
MIEGRAYIPAVFTVCGPRAALRWLFVCNSADARRGNESSVVVIRSVDLSPS